MTPSCGTVENRYVHLPMTRLPTSLEEPGLHRRLSRSLSKATAAGLFTGPVAWRIVHVPAVLSVKRLLLLRELFSQTRRTGAWLWMVTVSGLRFLAPSTSCLGLDGTEKMGSNKRPPAPNSAGGVRRIKISSCRTKTEGLNNSLASSPDRGQPPLPFVSLQSCFLQV